MPEELCVSSGPGRVPAHSDHTLLSQRNSGAAEPRGWWRPSGAQLNSVPTSEAAGEKQESDFFYFIEEKLQAEGDAVKDNAFKVAFYSAVFL